MQLSSTPFFAFTVARLLVQVVLTSAHLPLAELVTKHPVVAALYESRSADEVRGGGGP
jgi:hypothetical protein